MPRLDFPFSLTHRVAAIVLSAFMALSTGFAQPSIAAPRIENFSLTDASNVAWSLDAAKESKLVVVAFLGTECPLAKLYGPRLAKLAQTYQSRGVAFVAINSNAQDSLSEVAAYARQAGIAFPMLKDVGNRIADQFGAERTPEVFVLDADRTVRYRGRIDDQNGVGYTRDKPARRDLQVALDELLAGKSVSVSRTEADGCYIGRVLQPKTDSAVTYANQIARLLNKRCVECHRDGEIAPFALTKYEEVSGWAETIAEVVSEERMPPWHADPKHGHFADDRRLSDAEKQLVREWVAAGAPLGDPKQLPEPPTFPNAGWQIASQPDVVFNMAERPFVVKAEGEIRYQFFMVDPGFKEDTWVTAVEVLPGNRAVVHHCLIHVRGADGVGDGVDGFLAAYVPGLRTKPFPTGMAKRIPAGAKLIFQLHYTPNGTQQSDMTKLGLWLTSPENITHEVRTVSAVTRDFSIPPGADNHAVEARSRAAPPNTLLLGLMPHMHLRGKSFRYELVSSGEPETLLDIPRYDFNWQTAYRLPEPRPIPVGATMHAIAHFDNSAKNLSNPNPRATVRWGDQTYEEMMIGYFDIAVPRGQADAMQRTRGGEVVKLLDKNRDGQVSRDEVPDRFRKFFDQVAGDKNHVPVDDLIKAVERLRNRE